MELIHVGAWRLSGSNETTLHIYVHVPLLALPLRTRKLNRVYGKVCNLLCVTISTFGGSHWHRLEASPATRQPLSPVGTTDASADTYTSDVCCDKLHFDAPLVGWHMFRGAHTLKGWWQEVLLFEPIRITSTAMYKGQLSLYFPGTIRSSY
jgi:hypothetical protein